MEDFIDFRRIKEEIIETDSIIKKNAQLKKNIQQKNKQFKQLTNDLEILKLEYHYKLFQLDAKEKQCENFSNENLNLVSENSSIKEDYNKTLNDYQILHIKYQTVCQKLEESQKSLDQYNNTKLSDKLNRNFKKHLKRENLQPSEDNKDNMSIYSGNDSDESDEEGKLLEKNLTESPAYIKEDPDLHLQNQSNMEETNKDNTISEFKMKITHLTTSNNTLREEVSKCNATIEALNILLQTKEKEWLEKEKKLTTEIAELKRYLEYHKTQNNPSNKDNYHSIFDIEQENEEIQNLNLKDNLTDLSKKKLELVKTKDSPVSLGKSEVVSDFKSFSECDLAINRLEDMATEEMESELPSFVENEDLSDNESNISVDVNHICKEMKHYRLISPIPEINEDSLSFKNRTSTPELLKLEGTTVKTSIDESAESTIQNKYRNDRYNKQRELKAKMFSRMMIRQKAEHLYWKRKLKYIQKSNKTSKSNIKVNKIDTSESDLYDPMKKNIGDEYCAKNSPVGNIITLLVDLVSQHSRYPRARKKSNRAKHLVPNSNDCENDSSLNTIIHHNTLLAPSLKRSSSSERSSSGRSSSELDIPIFDSCYESLNSNPPSIENIIDDKKCNQDWQNQNKVLLNGSATGGKNEIDKSVHISEIDDKIYSMSSQYSHSKMKETLGDDLAVLNVEDEIINMNTLEGNSTFESNSRKNHDFNIQKDRLNEIEKTKSLSEEISGNINEDVKPNEHTEPLKHVQPIIDNFKINELNLEIEENPQIQNGKYSKPLDYIPPIVNSLEVRNKLNFSSEEGSQIQYENYNLCSSELKINKNIKSAENTAESEIMNTEAIEENSLSESSIDWMKGDSLNITNDGLSEIQKASSHFEQIAEKFDENIKAKYHSENLKHVHQIIGKLNTSDNFILDMEGNSQIQSEENDSNLDTLELEIDTNIKSGENHQVENDISNMNRILEENSTFERDINCLKVPKANIQAIELNGTQKYSNNTEEITEPIHELMKDKKHAEPCEPVQLLINDLELSDNHENKNAVNSKIQFRKHDSILTTSEFNVDADIKCNEESVKNENEIVSNNCYNQIHNITYNNFGNEEEECAFNVQKGCNESNMEMNKQSQYEDQKGYEFGAVSQFSEINRNSESIVYETNEETFINESHLNEDMDLNIFKIETEICQRNLNNMDDTVQVNKNDEHNLKLTNKENKFKGTYSKKRECSNFEKQSAKSEELLNNVKSVYNHNNMIFISSKNIVHDQFQMETDAELTGRVVLPIAKKGDLNNCYKLFHYDDTSSDLLENYGDPISTGAANNSSSKESRNISNENMWYEFGQNGLIDIRKSKSYQENYGIYGPVVGTNDTERSTRNSLISNKRRNDEEIPKVSKILKLEDLSCESLDCQESLESPMEFKNESTESKMKSYSSMCKNTTNLTNNCINYKTQACSNEHLKFKVNDSVEKLKSDTDTNMNKSCNLNITTDMEIDFNISQHLLEEIETKCLNEYPNICVPSSREPEGATRTYSEENDSKLVVNKKLSKYSELIYGVNDRNITQSSENSFSNNLYSNYTKLKDDQLKLCPKEGETTCKKKSSRNSNTTTKTIVSNYNLRKYSKCKKEKNILVSTAENDQKNILIPSNVSNNCEEDKKTIGTFPKCVNTRDNLAFNEGTDLFGSLSESSDDDTLSSNNLNKTSKKFATNSNLRKSLKLKENILLDSVAQKTQNISLNNLNCQINEKKSGDEYLKCIETKNVQGCSKETDLFGSLSESSEDECFLSRNSTSMFKTLSPNCKIKNSLEDESKVSLSHVSLEKLKDVPLNPWNENKISQDFSREIHSFGNKISDDDLISDETTINCKGIKLKQRRKSYKCKNQPKNKVLAKTGSLMKKSIKTYKNKNLAWNSAETQICVHNEKNINTNIKSSNIEENISSGISLNPCESYSPDNSVQSNNQNTESFNYSLNEKGQNIQEEAMESQSSIFKRSRTNLGTYSIKPIRATRASKIISKKVKQEKSPSSSSIGSNEEHDVKQNNQLSSLEGLQEKNDSLSLENTTAVTCEDSEGNYNITAKKIRKSLINPENRKIHNCLNNTLKTPLIQKQSLLHTDFNNDIKSENKDHKNPSVPPLVLNKTVSNTCSKDEKINILQEVVIRPSTTNPKKLEIHAPTQMRISGFKRPNNSKIIPPCPLSPPPPTTEDIVSHVDPIIIPLEKPAKMDPSKAAALFRKLITFSREEKTVEEISRQFTSQDVDHISRLILEQITQDTEKANKDDTSAPLMTDTQRVMLGFMLKLEEMNVKNLISTFLKISETRLLQVDTLQEIDTITRLYVAICKSHKYIGRIRRMCCDAFYFMGDFAIPFFFIILVSWIQVLPMQEEMESFPMVKVLIQLVNLKSCNFPGYNLLTLRDLLHKFYKYPSEPWNTDSFFKELFNNYLKNPVRPNDFAILLYCKNNISKWVYEKINNLIRPTLEIIKKENLKATVIILVGNIISQFNGKVDGEYIGSARQWLKCMIEGDDVPAVIRESVILSLRKLPKLQKKTESLVYKS